MLKKQNGFTLIELVLVIILLSIITAITSKIMAQGFNAFITGQNIASANWQGQIAMERMIRDMRDVRSAIDITTFTAGDFAFTDINGNAITYTLSGSNLQRNTQTLASGINTLTFTYYDKNGNNVTGSGSSTNIHYVTIAINVTQNNTNFSLTTTVYLRDLSS